jgi:hypothetical protein
MEKEMADLKKAQADALKNKKKWKATEAVGSSIPLNDSPDSIPMEEDPIVAMNKKSKRSTGYN